MEAVDRQQRGWPLSPQRFTLSFDLGERKREGSGGSPVAPESAAEAYYGSSGQETEGLACSYPSATEKSWPINNRKNGPKMPINHAAFSFSSGERLKISSSRLGILCRRTSRVAVTRKRRGFFRAERSEEKHKRRMCRRRTAAASFRLPPTAHQCSGTIVLAT